MVTTNDLDVGAQACQLAHAMREFAERYPEIEGQWYRESNAICFLVVPSGAELLELLEKAESEDIKYAPFHEEDLDNALTAVAFAPSLASRRLLAQIPLAFRKTVCNT